MPDTPEHDTKRRQPSEKGGNVILIGFMCSGKSTVGIRLSYRMRLPLTDTDKWIERKKKMTVSEIFAAEGEESFRRLETLALRELATQKERMVIATGGGLPMREENRRLLKELGTVVFLRVLPETVCKRLKGDHSRPLLEVEDPLERSRRLLAERNPLYEEAADVILDVDDLSYEEILDRIEAGCRTDAAGRMG